MMPTRYRIDEQRHTLFTQTTGAVWDANIRTLWQAILPDLEVSPGLNELHDFTGVTRTEVSTAYLWASAEEFKQFDSDERVLGKKVATVATTDLAYALCQLHATLRGLSPAEFRVFRSLSEAQEWLGLPAHGADSDLKWKEVGYS